MPVLLITSDNELFRVEREVALQSTLIRSILEEREDSEYPIPLPNVTAPIFKKVLEFCEHHRTDPLPTEDESPSHRRTTGMSEWDRKFIAEDEEMLFDIILAAHHLDIKSLTDVGCKTVANMIKGKSPEEIRKLFNIVNEFTPEEEAQIRKENEWAEDR